MKTAMIALAVSLAMAAPAAPPEPADDPAGDVVESEGNIVKSDLAPFEYRVTGNGLFIRQAVVDDTAYNREKYGPAPEIRYITIHNTAEPYTAMQERTRVNTRTGSVTSFQFAVDEKEAVQILPDNTHAWHAGDGRGDGNMKSIGIEICRSQCIGEDGPLYEASEANAVKLAAYLIRKYGLSVDDLRMHNDWTGKHCPHRILDAGSWNSFKARVADAMKRENGSVRVATGVAPSTALHDMAGINISSKKGVITYNTMYGKDFNDINTLVSDLKSNKIPSVTISSWAMDYDVSGLFSALQEAGIEVEACYIPVQGVPDWVRKNLITR